MSRSKSESFVLNYLIRDGQRTIESTKNALIYSILQILSKNLVWL